MPPVIPLYFCCFLYNNFSHKIPPGFDIMGMVYINKVVYTNMIALWMQYIHGGILRSIRVYLRPIYLYTNLLITLKKYCVPYDISFHVSFDLPKYYNHITIFPLISAVLYIPMVYISRLTSNLPMGIYQLEKPTNIFYLDTYYPNIRLEVSTSR